MSNDDWVTLARRQRPSLEPFDRPVFTAPRIRARRRRRRIIVAIGFVILVTIALTYYLVNVR